MKRTDNSFIKLFFGMVVAIALYLWFTQGNGAGHSVIESDEDSIVENTENVQKSPISSGIPQSESAGEATISDIGSRYEIPSFSKSSDAIVIEHYGYALQFNTIHNCPDWVAWELTKGETYGKLDRSEKFFADKKLPRRNRVDFYDYKESTYDRGHMCPSADMKWSKNAMYDCFLMSNMCPQNHELNSGSWRILENKCSCWARKEGSLFIICGPLWTSKKPEKIGVSHSVDVPDGFFKCILSLRKGHEKAIAFVFKNDASNQPVSRACVSVNEVERLTGIDFFCNLNDEIEEKLESSASLSAWR